MKIVFCLFLFVFSVQLGCAQDNIGGQQTEQDRRRQAKFQAELANIDGRLKSVWDNEIVAAVLQSHPSVDPTLMRHMGFIYESNPCALKIFIDPTGKTFTVPLSQNYLAFTYNYVLPLFLNLTGEQGFTNTEYVVQFTIESMKSQIANFYQEVCVWERAKSFSIKSPTGEIIGSRQEYINVMQRLSQNRHIRQLADEIAGLPILFVMLHEYAHAQLHHGDKDFSESQESSADQFAAEVFEAAKLPVSFGSLGILVYDGIAIGKSRRSLACRLARLNSESDVSSENSFFSSLPGGAIKIKELSKELMRYFDKQCL